MNLGVQNGAKMGIQIQTMKPRDDISKLAPRAPKTNSPTLVRHGSSPADAAYPLTFPPKQHQAEFMRQPYEN